MWRVGIDVGGTFTDLFAWDEVDNRQISSKVLTTKPDRSLGVMNALKDANIEASDISHLMHGTTTATNALITRDYPEVAMVTTNGFRDTIEIGRQHRAELYNPYQTKPKPIIKRRYRYTLDERMDVHGKVVRPLDQAAAKDIAKKIQDSNIQSVAVAFINSYVSSKHEDEMRDIILQENPNIYCITSSDTRALFREHGRFVTAAIRAATMPVMEQYFGHLENSLKEAGFSGRLLILKSSGGITEAEAKAWYHFENDNINVEYVQIPFDIIPDSLVNVKDSEIKQYIKEHNANYERPVSRNLHFVSFDENPTEADLDLITLRLEGLKDDQISYNDVSKLTDTIEGFKKTKNIIDFVDRYSIIPFDSIYRARGQFNNDYADILFGLEIGEVFGPYRDGKYFKISRLLDRKTDVVMMLNGALAGLVAITAEPLTPTPGLALAIGSCGSLIMYFGTKFLERMGLDDVVGAIPVHMFAGIFGTLIVPLTNSDTSFGSQFTGVIAVCSFSFILSFIIFKILKATIGLRISKEAEKLGTDVAEIGVRAYAIRD